MNSKQRFLSGKYLKDLSTFGIGGPARLFTEVTDIDQMKEAIAFCRAEGIAYIVIGKGSNCLFHDKGFDGLVISNKISFCTINDTDVFVGAGYSFSLLGVQTARQSLTGLEFACGIPASVGGAIYMNAGASGQETKDVLSEVVFINEQSEEEILPISALSFSYRKSPFQKRKGAIVAARFSLQRCDTARQKQLSIIDYRTKTQPYGQMSAGCLFRNPTGAAAGSLIEKVGLKGMQFGGAEVSDLHANFIVNKLGASAEDVLSLANLVRETVKEKAGVDLEMEIRCIPYKVDS